MMDLSNQSASFTTGCVAWQAGIRLLNKDVSMLQLIHIVGIIEVIIGYYQHIILFKKTFLGPCSVMRLVFRGFSIANRQSQIP